MAGSTFGAAEPFAVQTGMAGLHPDRNFDTIACLAREVGFGAAFARLTMGVRCALLAGDAAERLAAFLADAPGTAARGWDVRRTVGLDDAGRLRVEPLRAWLAQAPAAGADGGEPPLRAVVNEGAGPFLCRPLQMGADLVVEDVRLWADGRLLAAAGCDAGPCVAVVARSERAWSRGVQTCPSGELPVEPDQELEEALAGALGTLSLVCQRRSDTALVVAHYLAACPHVAWVSYPGLADDPANGAARRTLEHGFGAQVAFGVEPGDAQADAPRTDGAPAGESQGADALPGGCAASRIERVSPTSHVLHVGLESALDVVGWIDRFLKGTGCPVEYNSGGIG